MKAIRFHGALLHVDDDGAVQSVSSEFELEEVNSAIETFDDSDRVLVAGGGTGWLAAWVAWCSGYVLAVEPNSHWAQAMKDNVSVDGAEIHVLPGALGLRRAVGRLVIDDIWAEGRIVPDRNGDIEIHAIDYLISNWAINALSLDVEGAELDLLMSMDLRPIKKIQVEMHEYRFKRREQDTLMLSAHLAEQGFVEVRSHKRFTTVNFGDIVRGTSTVKPTSEVRCVDKIFLHETEFSTEDPK